ncbi:cysteine proteinase [Xylariaceae sp. FL0594]|nr:cysteine proteinase [Xylariaceae sp. FL0594]
MMSNGLHRKFLSRRERHSHRQDKSEGSHKHRQMSSDLLHSIFKSDVTKQLKAEEKEAAKIELVKQKLVSLGLDLPGLEDRYILYALNSKHASMDVDKAIEILLLQQDAISGVITSYDPAVHMVGAENRGNVTCYLDALLFAMFAKLEAFECMLKADVRDDEPRKRLVVLLRLWVNMLRSGKLIDTEMTERIQDALADCGWKEAQYLEQQDTSEAFAFITDKLQLPLLTLQADLFHHGKNDDADHKVVFERLLNLAVPADPDGKGIKLEDCLEEYFNSKVDVLREGSDEKKMLDRRDTYASPSPSSGLGSPKSNIRVVHEEFAGTPTSSRSFFARGIESDTDARVAGPEFEAGPSDSGSTLVLRPQRSRTDSIIRRVVIDKQEKKQDTQSRGLVEKARERASVVKAVTIPAWQFFKLIPWHSSESIEPQNDSDVAMQFNQRPVVGICLKRYMMDQDGVMKRQNTYIDIPESLTLPHFILDDRHVEEGSLSNEYRLELQSVVCHRGDSLHSGHYVSFSRVAPRLLTFNRRHAKDAPPDYEEAQWVKFDDLAPERVVPVDDIKLALKEEMPYLLFYQIIPTFPLSATASSVGSKGPGPPAYGEHAPPLVITGADEGQDQENVSRKTSSYFENSSGLPSAAPSVRFSVDSERPARHSFAEDDALYPPSPYPTSRRASIAYGDLFAANTDWTTNGHQPAVSPGEETTAQRLGRAAAKFKSSNRSRPPSQAGERLSQAMSKLGLIRTSDEPPRGSTTVLPNSEGDLIILDVVSNGQAEKEPSSRQKGKGKENGSPRKRSKSKTPFGKGKSKEDDDTERQCIIQ